MTTPTSLHRFFSPSVVAVVGATDTEGRQQTINWRMLRRWAERAGASVYPVNPNRESVDGVPCLKRLADVPGPIDVVTVLVADAAGVLAEAVNCAAAFVVVFAAGFAETGADGRDAQQRLVDIVRGTSTRLIGPNTNMNAFELFRDDLDGPAIALISQSGHQGRPLFMMQENGIRVTHWAPTGNEADVEASDFVAYFAEQPDIGCIAAYIEGFADGDRFTAAGRHAVEQSTPITLVKVGRTAAGRAAAATHTGKLTGGDRVADGAFRQLGMTRVDTLDQLADVAQILARGRPPASDGIAVYSISGGTGAHHADLLGMAGLRLAQLSDETVATLHELIPSYLRVDNPVDCGGPPVGDERGAKIIDALLADPDVGVLLCPITGPFAPLSDRLAADLAAAAERTDKLICVVWGSPVGTEPALRDVLYGSQRLAVFRSSANCVQAIGAWLHWHEYLRRHRDEVARYAPPPPADRAALDAALAGHAPGALNEHDAKRVLAAGGVPVAREVLATSAEEAKAAAEAFGCPVVLKVCSEGIAHKTELGLVRVGVGSGEDAAAVFDELAARAAQVAPDAVVDGVIVAEQIPAGFEIVIGIVRDPEFGLAMMAGIGGVSVEVLGDVSFRLLPFGPGDAAEMLDELRGAPLLGAIRGRPAVDREALVETMMRVQQVALGLGERLVEMEINPLIADDRGNVAVDALVVLGEPSVT